MFAVLSVTLMKYLKLVDSDVNHAGLAQKVKQLKNRYNDPTVYKRFVVGIDRAKMRLYDCEQSAQKDILDSGDDCDYNDEERFRKPIKKTFEGFKF